MQLINDLAMIFMKAGYEELQKSYDLFSMMESVDKQLEVIETERMFITKAIEGKVLNTDVITQHEFMSRFPAINSKIKEANEGMEDALNEAKQHYDKYKSLVMKVKNDYFSRNAEDLQRDMQQLAPRVAYLAQIVQDVIQSFGVQKRSRNILDFSDYEHFALRILTNEDGSPSRIAETYREHFKEILVDEYQDTNRVQEKYYLVLKLVKNTMVTCSWLGM